MTKTPTADLNYELKNEAIAQYRYKEPSESKLLIASTRKIITFDEYIQKLKHQSVFIFNKSTVQNVRIETFKSITGGKIEFFILNIIDSNTAEVLIKTTTKLKLKSELKTDVAFVKIMHKENDIYLSLIHI